MALTSGGYGRDELLTPFEAMRKNMDFSFAAAPEFLKQFPVIDPKEIILPSELGKVKGWNQADYLSFFFYMFTGAYPDVIREVDRKIQETGVRDLPSFTAPAELRQKSDYDSLVWRTIRALEATLEKCNFKAFGATNIQSGLFLNDMHGSLGTWAEGEFMRNIGIPPQICHMNADLVAAADQRYLDHREALHALGATVLGSDLNWGGVAFLGVMSGHFNPNFASRAGFRKTGLMNLILADEYYKEHPERVPVRHGGNTPIKEPLMQNRLF